MSIKLHRGGDARSRLLELQSSQEQLHDAMYRAELARTLITADHPRNSRGLVFWIELAAALRSIMALQGWLRRDLRGMPLIVNPEGTIAITPWSGDPNTGVVGNDPPTTRGKHGIVKLRLQEAPRLSLFDALSGWERKEDLSEDLQIWGLITYHRPKNRLYAELSLPSAVSKQGRVIGWAERVILDPLEFDPQGRHQVPLEPPPPVDISVYRKAR